MIPLSRRGKCLDHFFVYLGVHNVLITWIGSFLTNRWQSVKISSAILGHVVPRGGIPQGTKLAPLLFAVLVNNLARQLKIRAK